MDVVETPGDYYTITAQDSADPSIKYWQIKVDILSGGIYSFKDLTDAGDGSGDHTDYLGNGAYNRNCTLIYFDGRTGNVCTRRGPLAGIADRMTYDEAGDGSSFTITYTETAAAASFFHGFYEAGSMSLSEGDLLTTIIVTIRPPTADGTMFDWRMEFENVSDHDLTPKIWADESVWTWIDDGIVRTADSETSLVDGPYNPMSMSSYVRWTIGDNVAAGLTTGREIILDYQTGMTNRASGGYVAQNTWAGFGYFEYNSPFNLSGTPLVIGNTQIHSGQLIIDIAGSTPGAPSADAGPDQSIQTPVPEGASVTLDGSGSVDDDGTIASYVWSNGASQIATGVNPTVDFPLGFYVITLTVTDNDGITDTDTVVVDVALSGANRTFYVDFDGGDDSNHGRSRGHARQRYAGSGCERGDLR